MPRGDGTGPLGYGPMTGRRMGFCAGYDRPSFGRSFGFGFGRGRGFGRGVFNYQGSFPEDYPEALITGDDASMLEGEVKRLKSVMDNILDRLDSLKKKKVDSSKDQ